MLASLLALAACTTPDPGDSAVADDAVDVRVTPDDLDEPEDAALFYGPDVYIEPGDDIMWCVAGTYTGEDAAIVELSTYQGQYGHHMVLNGTTLGPLDLPDGTVWDCTSADNLQMADQEPIAFPTRANNADGTFDIPDGFGIKLDSGQRWVVQSHYVNAGTDRLHVRDIAAMQTIDPEEVETWAAPFFMSHEQFSVPPGESLHSEYEITLENDLHVLQLVGHLHEWGTAFALVSTVDGVETTLYDVPSWEPTFRDDAPFLGFEPGEMTLPAGSTLRNECDWFNDTDEALTFPHEMCVTAGLVYPFTAALGYSD